MRTELIGQNVCISCDIIPPLVTGVFLPRHLRLTSDPQLRNREPWRTDRTGSSAWRTREETQRHTAAMENLSGTCLCISEQNQLTGLNPPSVFFFWFGTEIWFQVRTESKMRFLNTLSLYYKLYVSSGTCLFHASTACHFASALQSPGQPTHFLSLPQGVSAAPLCSFFRNNISQYNSNPTFMEEDENVFEFSLSQNSEKKVKTQIHFSCGLHPPP